MNKIFDFDLDLNTGEYEQDNSGSDPQFVPTTVPCTIVYSIIGISVAFSASSGATDPDWTESKCK